MQRARKAKYDEVKISTTYRLDMARGALAPMGTTTAQAQTPAEVVLHSFSSPTSGAYP